MAISLMTSAIGNIITLLITEAFKHVFGPNELVRCEALATCTYAQYIAIIFHFANWQLILYISGLQLFHLCWPNVP